MLRGIKRTHGNASLLRLPVIEDIVVAIFVHWTCAFQNTV